MEDMLNHHNHASAILSQDPSKSHYLAASRNKGRQTMAKEEGKLSSTSDIKTPTSRWRIEAVDHNGAHTAVPARVGALRANSTVPLLTQKLSRRES
eukprot:COSAG02_NODE_10567_length_1911_cov_85.550773_3_plen_96_part_00